MYFYIFGNFRELNRLPALHTVISDVVTPLSAADKEALETSIKLFYEPHEDVDAIIQDMIDRGFTLVDRNPYTLILVMKQRYKRVLKEIITPDEFIKRRHLYSNLSIVFNGSSFEIYEDIPDGSERVVLYTKHYYNDRVIFKL